MRSNALCSGMKRFYLMLCVALAFCGARADGTVDTVLRAGDTIPDFAAQTLDGKPIRWSDVKDQPVFLYFWSRACQTCGNEYDLVEQLAADNPGLRVIGLNVSDSVNTAKYVAEQEGFKFEVWTQSPSNPNLKDRLMAWQGLEEDAPILSWAYLVGKDGVIRTFHMGFKDAILETVKNEAFSTAPVTLGMRPGRPMPNFALQDSSGKSVELKDSLGSVVILNFWGSWCPPCRAEMPELNALYGRYKGKGLRVIGVNYAESKEKALTYLEANPLGYDVWFGADAKATGALFRAWGGTGVPWNIIIGRDGKVHSWMVGFGPGAIETMEKRVLELI